MLTDQAIRSAKPGDKPYRITDGRGLFLLIKPNGGKLWRYNYRFNGLQKTLALGVYPDTSAKLARQKLDDARQLLAKGVDPMVGEYLVLRGDQLHTLIHHRLTQGSDLYDELKSRHFIRDADSDVAVDLLALKYRTKLARVSQFTSLHMFVVTLRCDYSAHIKPQKLT